MVEPVYQREGITLYHGKSESVVASLPDNSVDSIVTDPPYELGFMGKSWDSTGIAYNVAFWRECLRVLKPGGHLLAFGGSRTYHRLACAVEDAGFEIRDQIQWVYGSGFPKSLDVSKAIDKAAGAEREVVGFDDDYARRNINGKYGLSVSGNDNQQIRASEKAITAPATESARQWSGWGTALKPAHEPIVVARKPLSEGTVAANVLRWGTGGVNVDGCRIETDEETGRKNKRGPYESERTWSTSKTGPQDSTGHGKGRFPANLIHDGSEEVLAGFPVNPKAASGEVKVSSGKKSGDGTWSGSGMQRAGAENTGVRDFGDSGSAARFFYSAKASRSERNGSKHPTVKPLALMRYLCRLVTPPGGTVLEPFAGSGTTIEATRDEGFACTAIEQDAEYVRDCVARIEKAFADKAEMLPM